MAADLTPYIPRLLIDWQHDTPDALWRETPGTLVFVDISGFTAMSERLARTGKQGAEEVTEILGASFARLLASAYDEGGSLLKFGGDALLLFFSGADHAVRGCRAVVEMRRRLRETRSLRTSVGFISLRMSAGVHSGNVEFFLAGESHRELIVAGPAASSVVSMESAATAGQILVSADTLSELPPGCVGEMKSGGFLLRRAPRPTSSGNAADIAPEASFDAALYVPTAIRRHLRLGAQESEHRQVTIAFIHFSGIDAAIQGAGIGSAAQHLDGLMRAVQAAAEEHAVCVLGTDIDRDGGKIILSSGAPLSLGDDEARMLRALRQIGDGEFGPLLRVGVNRGYVFAGDVGPSYRRTYTVMGDAVNLAARLMARAADGEIIVSPDVLARSRAQFAVEQLEPFMVKGKAKPVAAVKLGAAQRTRAPRAIHAVPLVGREPELARLVATLETAGRGSVTTAQVIGEAGSGKSRLLLELKKHAKDARVVETAGEQYESSTAYYPFRRLLRHLLDIDDDADPETAGALLRHAVSRHAPELTARLPLLAAPVDARIPEGPDATQMRPGFRTALLHDAVTRLISALVPGTALFMFEDAHWFDDASRELLVSLARATDKPWMFCATARDEAGAPFTSEAAVVTMHVKPLSAEGALELAKVLMADVPVSDADLNLIASRSDGNPLFLQEIVASRGAGDSADRLPESIEAVLTSRMDRLDAEDRLILRYAAVFGASFTTQDLAAMGEVNLSGRSLVPGPLDEFLESMGPDVFRFRHALLREVAYEALPFRRRRNLHSAIGDRIERSSERPVDHAEILSLHFDRAQLFEKSWRYSLAAADRAKAKYANVEAGMFYRRALDAARRVPGADSAEVARALEGLGDVSELSASYQVAARAYRDARNMQPSPSEHRIALMHKEGVVRERLGRYGAALRYYGRALRELDASRTESIRIKLGLAYAGVRFRQGRYADCVGWCQKMLPYAELAGDRAAIAHAYYLLDHAYTFLGNAESARYRSLALPIYEELGDLVGQANVLNNLGVAAYIEGRWREALEFYERSRVARDGAGDIVGAATAANNIAEILSDQGRLAEAERLFVDALRVWRAARYSVGIALATGNLGRVASRGGRFGEADRLLRDSVDGFQSIGANSFAFEAESRIAELRVFSGAYADALEILDGLIRRMLDERIESLPGVSAVGAWLYRLQAAALLAIGDRPAASDILDKSEEDARRSSAEFELAQTLDLRDRALGNAHELARAEVEELIDRLGIVALPDLARAGHQRGDGGYGATGSHRASVPAG